MFKMLSFMLRLFCHNKKKNEKKKGKKGKLTITCRRDNLSVTVQGFNL